MDLSTIPLFSMLQGKLGYLSERQKVIAENVANASTPGFTPHDLKPFSEQPGVSGHGSSITMAQTENSDEDSSGSGSSGFIAMSGGKLSPTTFKNVAMPDSETTLDGNQVVLEEQMLKMSQARTEYDAAIGFYEKAMNLLHMAVHKPGT